MLKLKNTKKIIIFAGSCGLAIFYVLIIAMNNFISQGDLSWRYILDATLYGATFYIIDGFLIYKVMQRLGRYKWSIDHEIASTVLQILMTMAVASLCVIVGFKYLDPKPYASLLSMLQTKHILLSILTCCALNIFTLIISKYLVQIEINEQNMDNMRRIENELVSVQYKQLKAQVNPHFLFNSLNILISLIKHDPDKATEYTRKLASLYRYILYSDNNDLVPLAEEIEFARQYANIMTVRFGDGVKIIFPDKKDLQQEKIHYIIPTTLQVLIENACKHNVITDESPITINITINDNKIQVENNIIARSVPADSTGLGLKGLKEKYLIIAKMQISETQTEKTFAVVIPLIDTIQYNTIQYNTIQYNTTKKQTG